MEIEERLRVYFHGQSRFGMTSVYLFGRHGAGRAHRESDIDVGVLIDRGRHPLLGRRVVTEGLRVFCADPEADHRYVRDVQLRAADLRPFLERTRRIKLEALRRCRFSSASPSSDLERVVAVLDEPGPIEKFADRLAEHLADTSGDRPAE